MTKKDKKNHYSNQPSNKARLKKSGSGDFDKKETGHENEKEQGRKHARLKADIILNFLEAKSDVASSKEIAQALGRDSKRGIKETESLLEQLRDSKKISQVRKHRWAANNQAKYIQGRVVGHFDGHGFVIPEGGGDRVFLNSHDMREVLHGDTVNVRLTGRDSRKKLYGKIDSVLERGNDKVVGRFFEERGLFFVVPQDQRINQDIFVPSPYVGGKTEEEGGVKPENGQVVIVEITQQPTRNFQPSGEISKVLGDYLAPGMEIQIAINEHFIPNEWMPQIDEELAKIPDEVVGDDFLREGGRRDIRDLPLVTIDGEDARDFDDAVYCEVVPEDQGGGYRLIVAIADVSHYVKQGSNLDTEAFERGNSTYFPRQVIPMLPEKLSNGLCSLNPKVDRLCFVCDMHFNKLGVRQGFEFYTGVMKSQARLTYTQVAAYVNEEELSAEDSDLFTDTIIGSLKNLLSLTNALGERRRSIGSIDLDIPEPVIIFNEDRKIESVEPRERNLAHRLIEECMLAANVSAADFLEESDLAGVYRVHESPDEEKVDDARQFIRQFGLMLNGGAEPSPKDYSGLLAKVNDDVTKRVVNQALLRSFKQARYSNENDGHFALAFGSYTHFTSPIRRYADLFVHRQIKRLIANDSLKKPSETTLEKEEEYALSIADQTSITERRSEKASRDVVQWLKCEFMKHKVGDVFTGMVTAVTDFGMFVELDDFFIEGLVHIKSLADDYYIYNETDRVLRGESKGQVFGAGKTVKVQVVRVDLEQRRIDFELDGMKRSDKGRSGKYGGKRSGGKKGKSYKGGSSKSGSSKTGSSKTGNRPKGGKAKSSNKHRKGDSKNNKRQK